MMDGRSLTLVATCSRGLEQVLAAEIEVLGGGEVEVGRGMVRFLGGIDLLLRANLELRTAIRLLLSLASGPAGDRQALYALAASVAWEELVGRGQSIAVDVAGRAPAFRDTRFAALVVKDAIVDRLRAKMGWRPDVDRSGADVRVHLHLGVDESSIGLDSSGEPLSHRGYRPRGGPAPLSESLAAGLLLLAGYEGEAPLCDPMCGTGTIAIEGALLATRTAPGLRRSFAMERWGWLDRRIGQRLRQELRDRRRPAPFPILASDADEAAVRATRRNALEAGVAPEVESSRCRLRDMPVLPAGALLVTNPPYGVRLGDPHTLEEVYRELGQALKRAAGGCSAWILAGAPALLAQLRLRPARRLVLFNGPLECRFVRYDLHGGSPPGGRRRPAGPAKEGISWG
ncbi:MAG: hypothetical protein HRF46_01875 [Acidobacteriota bacterium]